MKKILLLMVCLVMVGMQSVNAQTPAAIMLMHQGKATLYSNQQLPTAVAAAEAGDTIFLSNGTYSVATGLTVDKPISLIGAGQGTVIAGNMTVDIENTATVVGRFMDGIRLTRGLDFVSSPDNIIIRKCWIPINFWLREGCGSISIDRCYVRYLLNYGFTNNFSATNSVISQYGNGETTKTGNVIFTNCNFGTLNNSVHGNLTFVNCLIGDCFYSDVSNIYVKCVGGYYTNNTNYGTFDSCYKIDDNGNIATLDDNTGFPTFQTCTKEFLESNGYLGTDGTIIGAEGGSTPYNLNPSLPTVSQSSFTVDNSTRTLNVTLTVTAE